VFPSGGENGAGADERMATLRHHAPPGFNIRLVLVAPCFAAAAVAGRGDVGGRLALAGRRGGEFLFDGGCQLSATQAISGDGSKGSRSHGIWNEPGP